MNSVPGRVAWLSLCLALVGGMVQAAPAWSLVPGTYGYSQPSSRGDLEVDDVMSGSQRFHVLTFGDGGERCKFDGTLGSEGVEIDDNPKDADFCDLKLVQRRNAISLEDKGANGCRRFCGDAYSLPSFFALLPPACANATATSEFKQQYDAHQYRTALATLRGFYQACRQTISQLEAWQILNDLAITQYHLKQGKACLATLRPFQPYVGHADTDLRNVFGGADGPMYVEQVQAARTNLRLCQGLAPGTKAR